MRHFHSKVVNQRCFAVPVHNALTPRDFLHNYDKAVDVLNHYLDGNTPASNEVRDSLREWFSELALHAPNPGTWGDVPNGCFFYANVNTGHSVLFIADYGYGCFAARSVI